MSEPPSPLSPPAGAGTTSGKAVAALIFGILGVVSCAPLGIVALILGNQAKEEIQLSAGQVEGDGLATAGVILGWIGIAILILQALLAILFLAMMPALTLHAERL